MLIPQSHGLICAPSKHFIRCLLQDPRLGPLNADMKAGHSIMPCDASVFAHYVNRLLKCVDFLLAVELVRSDILAGALLPPRSERPAKHGLIRLIMQK